MLNFVGTTRIDFLRWSKPAFALSWLLIFLGIGWGFKRGKEVVGVDFAGGDAITFAVTQEPDVDRVRAALAALPGVGDPQIQFSRDISGTSQRNLQISTPFNTSHLVISELQRRFPEVGFTQVATVKHGATVGK